jgi:hypothetical protein
MRVTVVGGVRLIHGYAYDLRARIQRGGTCPVNDISRREAGCDDKNDAIHQCRQNAAVGQIGKRGRIQHHVSS